MEEQYTVPQIQPGPCGGARVREVGCCVRGDKGGRRVEEQKYGCKERGKVTFMAQRRADTSSPWLRKATEVSC